MRDSSNVSRRTFIGGAFGAGVALAAAPRAMLAALDSAPPAAAPRSRPAYGTGLPTHLAWVWQFNHDGPREAVRDVLAAYGLGIVLKTHDGPDWMSRYDRTPEGVTGARKVEELANFFENGGVPFHAWAVLHGTNPAREAEMAADVLSAGARSLSMDLEPHQGFWRGTPEDAAQYGSALRWRAPSASLIVSVDPRPWVLDRTPLDQFAAFSDALAPQVYWQAFSTPSNLARYARAGYDAGPAGMTASFTLGVTMRSLERFNLPVTPVGDGTATAMEDWREFIDASYNHEAEAVSVWRYGVASPALWELLRDAPPRVSAYVVEPGDTLSGIARRLGVDLGSLIEVNGIANPNMISAGQQLRLPRGARVASAAPTSSAAASEPAPVGGGTYTIEPGDSLWSLARRHNTSIDTIARLNNIADPSRIRIGQRLNLP